MSMRPVTMRGPCSICWNQVGRPSSPPPTTALALALSGRMDAHFTALWDHGHIKFWSKRTLGELLREAGFVEIRFEWVGRVPALAKAMIAVARKP